jgi:transitional endoplasmic reticulum ATPase
MCASRLKNFADLINDDDFDEADSVEIRGISKNILGSKKQVQIWVLRILLKLGIFNELQRPLIENNKTLLSFFDINTCKDKDGESFEKSVKTLLIKKLKELSSEQSKLAGRGCFYRNVSWLANTLGLNADESKIMEFVLILDHDIYLRSAIKKLGAISNAQVFSIFSKILDLDDKKLRKCLEATSTLQRTGVVDFNYWGSGTLLSRLSTLEALSLNILNSKIDMTVFDDDFKKTAKSDLTIADFSQLKTEITLLTSYVNQAIKAKKRGVNVLIYGPPGCGKTQFVKSLADSMKIDLYEVRTPLGRKEGLSWRMRSYLLAQKVLAKVSGAAVIFDEVEDVFDQEFQTGSFAYANKTGVKGFVNVILEGNFCPTFWVSNQIDVLDPAYRSRFDYFIEMKIPPKNVRECVIERHVGSLAVSPQWVAGLACRNDVSPRSIEKAATFTKIVCGSDSKLNVETVFDDVLGKTTKAMYGERTGNEYQKNTNAYSTTLINSDCDLKSILDSLQTDSEARICLYGPPGTGKSAFVSHLTGHLGKSLVSKKGSDILGKYIGETEQNLANAFAEASTNSGVLLLDEIDGLLFDRGHSSKTWQISMVNELLMQMDQFSGILVTTTNYFEKLDQAAMRRFDLKIKFDYLRPHQIEDLVKTYLKNFNLDFNEVFLEKAKTLQKLTPGDFSNIARQSKISRIICVDDFYNRLEKEVACKRESASKPIGFLTYA